DPLSYGYQNVLIQNNAIYANDAYHGIFVNGATGVQILDNTVTSNPNDSKMFWIFATNSSDVAIQNNVTDRITAVNVTNLFQDGNLDFQVNPAARADLPSLASPSDAHDLITAGAGYQLRGDAPDSPVSSAVGTAIGDMLARVGGSSAGHKVVGESSTLLHDAASTASPELDLGGLKAIVGDAQPAAPVQHHFAHEVAIQPTVREMMGHLFLDHFVALP
ncbi:right-handed parallel beta-helix repeat-containing protein, partial [Sphingomonas sp. CGMCC 1.13658]